MGFCGCNPDWEFHGAACLNGMHGQLRGRLWPHSEGVAMACLCTETTQCATCAPSGPIVADIGIPDDVTPRVMAGGSQFAEDVAVVGESDVAAWEAGIDLAMTAMSMQRSAFLDGVLWAGYWLRRDHQRAGQMAEQYEFHSDVLSQAAAALRSGR